MGHTVRKPLPALVPLLSDDRNLKASAGVRCDAEVTLICDRNAVSSERGELQMTEKGISGIPVFQLSGEAARALDRGAEVEACIDFLPGFGKQAWEEETERRLSEDKNCMLSVFFLGPVNRKILDLVFRRRGLQAEMKASRLTREGLRGIMEDLRAFRIQITGTGTFRQAQVTSGGVPLDEMDEDLQSLLCPGLFMAGELLDVDGICGGYNLQWAMTSGWIAGKGAARETLK
jgi:predicted Rossmann fold flavoprotein